MDQRQINHQTVISLLEGITDLLRYVVFPVQNTVHYRYNSTEYCSLPLQQYRILFTTVSTSETHHFTSSGMNSAPES
jgi:urate oxidase